MADANPDLRTRLEERLGALKLAERMDEIRRETGGLLDGRAILALLADEQGLTETEFSSLSGLDPSRPVFTRCVIEAIEQPREFQGRDRGGKLRKLRVADDTGTLTLTLWDEEVGLVEQLGIRPGSRVRILSATLRESRFGREIQVGKTGFVIHDEADRDDGPSRPCEIGELSRAPGRADVKGVILSLNTTGRGRQKVTAIRLFDGTGECELTVPHEQLAPSAGLVQGMEIEVTGALVDLRDGKPGLLCDRRSGLKII